MSSILGAIQSQQYGQYPYTTSNFTDLSQVAVAQTATEVADDSVSLNANLSNVTAATSSGKLTLAFAQALQSATEVDPATGQREIIAGANTKLTNTLNTLLEQNGFSAAQASAATANLATELAQGGQITLSASYDQATQASAAISANYSSGASSWASAVSSTDRSGAISIGINLATGTLNLALITQNSSSYQSQSEIEGSGTLSAPVGQLLTLPSDGSTSGSGSGSASSASADSLLSADNVSDLASLVSPSAGLSPAAFGTASANSPLSESEVDSYSYAEVATISLSNYAQSNDTSGQDAAPASAGGTGDTGASDGSGAAAQSTSVEIEQASVLSYASTAASAENSVNDNTEETLKKILADLNNARVLSQQQTGHLLQGLAKLANQASATAQGQAADQASAASAANGSSDDSNAATAATDASQSSSAVSVQISFTQTLTIQQLDLAGYGSTLFQRPDGSLGKISTQPTYATA